MKSVKRPKKKTTKKNIKVSSMTIEIINRDGEKSTPDLLTVNVAAKMLGVSRNTVKNYAARGQIGCIWVCKNEPERIMLFFRSDIEDLKNEKAENLKDKLKKLEE